MMSMFILKAVLMLGMPWYRTDLSLPPYPKAFSYLEYSNGKVIKRRIIDDHDATFEALKEFLSSERKGWKYDLDSYAANRLFESADLKINCTEKNGIIVNYKDSSGDWVQLSKTASSPCPMFR